LPVRQDTLRDRWLLQQRYATTTAATYQDTLKAFQRRFPVMAERVTSTMLVDFLTTDDNGEPTTRAANTLKRQRATLRTFWSWCARQGYVRTNPAADLAELNLGQGQRRAGRWLTQEDALALLDSCVADPEPHGIRDHALIATALLTGLRRAELASLRWRDVDLVQRRLSVYGKGSKFGTVGLPEQAATSLRRWREHVIAAHGRRSWAYAPVFPTGRVIGLHERSYVFDWSRPLMPEGLWKIIARRAEDAGLGTVAPHDLRRSFAGFLEERGVDLGGIQAALRHSSPDVTQRCYLERSPRRALRAVADLALSAPLAGEPQGEQQS
jgi:integrase